MVGSFFGTEIMLADFKRQKILPDWYLRYLRIYLEEQRDWLEEHGSIFRILLVPNKHNVYGEFFSPHVVQGTESPVIDHAATYFERYFHGAVINTLPVLLKMKYERPVFFKIDTHWNSYGAWIATRELVKSLGREKINVNLDLIDKVTFKRRVMKNGNFGRVMGVPFRETEVVPIPIYPGRKDDSLINIYRELNPIHTKIRVLKNKMNMGASVLLIGDSYSGSMAKYLGASFSQAVVVNYFPAKATWPARFSTHFIETVKPDVYVLEIVERFFVPCIPLKCRFYYAGFNPPEVRQARLRRLFEFEAAEADPLPSVDFIRRKITDKVCSIEVPLPTTVLQMDEALLARITFSQPISATINSGSSTDDPVLRWEVTSFNKPEKIKEAFVFIPPKQKRLSVKTSCMFPLRDISVTVAHISYSMI